MLRKKQAVYIRTQIYRSVTKTVHYQLSVFLNKCTGPQTLTVKSSKFVIVLNSLVEMEEPLISEEIRSPIKSSSNRPTFEE